MEWLQTVGAVSGIIVAILGVIGGLINLFSCFKKWEHDRRPRGTRGARFLFLGRIEHDESWEYHFLVLGDLEQVLMPIAKELAITHVGKVGEYYEFRGKAEIGREFSLVRKPTVN